VSTCSAHGKLQCQALVDDAQLEIPCYALRYHDCGQVTSSPPIGGARHAHAHW
jgi:hypothetical protein